MREVLKKARQEAGLTQKQVADKLGITVRSYQRIETGESEGKIKHWDMLEDLFNIHQRTLRKIIIHNERYLYKQPQRIHSNLSRALHEPFKESQIRYRSQ